MPDITITITNEEVTVLESYFTTAEEGLINSARRRIKVLARNIVKESTSKYDADKLTTIELKNLIAQLDTDGEIPTYAERNPD